GPLGSFGLAEPGDLEHLGHLAPDSHRRVERPAWLLIHHGYGPCPQIPQGFAAEPGDILAPDGDRPGAHLPVPGKVTDCCKGHRALAAPGFAHETERFPAPDLERDVPYREASGTPDGVRHVHVAGIQDDLVQGGTPGTLETPGTNLWRSGYG